MEREVIPLKTATAVVLLLRPSLVFLLAQSPDLAQVESALPPGLTTAPYLFLALNNNDDPSVPEGGSHWTLLLVHKTECLALHYDSLACTNEVEARRITTRMSKMLGVQLRYVNMETPQQSNGSDCGVYVCLETSALLSRIFNHPDCAPSGSELFLHDASFDANHGRQELQTLVNEMISKRGTKVGSREDVRIDRQASVN